MTTLEAITGWLHEGKEMKDITHMLVVCDDFDYHDYPAYVPKSENVRDVYARYHDKNMQRVMEVYSYKQSLSGQLSQTRAMCFD